MGIRVVACDIFDTTVSAELARTYKPDAAGLRTAFVDRPQEKGPHRQADRAEDVECDLYADSFLDLATQLDTP